MLYTTLKATLVLLASAGIASGAKRANVSSEPRISRVSQALDQILKENPKLAAKFNLINNGSSSSSSSDEELDVRMIIDAINSGSSSSSSSDEEIDAIQAAIDNMIVEALDKIISSSSSSDEEMDAVMIVQALSSSSSSSSSDSQETFEMEYMEIEQEVEYEVATETEPALIDDAPENNFNIDNIYVNDVNINFERDMRPLINHVINTYPEPQQMFAGFSPGMQQLIGDIINEEPIEINLSDL